MLLPPHKFTGFTRTACQTALFSAAMVLAPPLAGAQTVPATPLETSGAVKVDITLKGYLFGIKVMRANYGAVFDDHTYVANAQLKTSGLGAFLKKFKIWSQTIGHLSSGASQARDLRPLAHVQQNMDKKHRRVQMQYGQDAVKVHIVPPLGSQGKPPASPTERFESDDALSALLNMMMQGTSTAKAPCSGLVPVFDSKQHYNLRLEQVGTRDLKQRGYKGPTIKCHAYYEAVSGFDPEDLPSREEAAAPMVLYMAKFDEAGLYIPVRITYKISGFKAVIKAREINISKAAPNALANIAQDMTDLASMKNPYGDTSMAK